MPDDDYEDDPSVYGRPAGLKDQIIGTSRTFLAYIQARAQLFALEAREASEQTGRRLAYFAIGGGITFLGYAILVVALVPLIAKWLSVDWHLIGLVFAFLHVAVGIGILRYATKAFSKTPFEESQNELEKDREWLARNLPTSNAKKPH
ncbi:MAG: phage holin family protein [Verrucomicrobiota bacterium]